MTRILAFSDLHLASNRAEALVAASKDADLVIGAGDFCNHRKGLPEAIGLLSDISCPCILVPGNAESADELTEAAANNMVVLHGTGTIVDGISIFGLGYAVPRTPFGDWSCDLDEDEADVLLSNCDEADILITHSPPKGLADKTSAGQSFGSTAVRAAIERIQPSLVFCGHIHDSWGQTGMIGRSHVANLGPTPNWFDL
ncbi:MAG: metallophosphoesterase [Pseudomonadota bacterium]